MDKESRKNHEQDNSGIDIELQEKLLSFWSKYNSHMLMVLVVVCLVVIGVQGVKFYKQHQVKKLQDSYLEAKIEGTELEFAEAHAMEPLSGVVWLEAGDSAYDKQDYAQAKVYYEKSVKALRKTLLKGRGRMGIAMSEIMGGDESVGKDLLADIVYDKQAMGVLRGQAAYQLALLALELKDYKEASEFLDMIKHIPDSGIWEQKGLVLADSTPELVAQESK